MSRQSLRYRVSPQCSPGVHRKRATASKVDIEAAEEADSKRVARSRAGARGKAKELPRKGLGQETGETAGPLTVAVEARRSPEEEVVVSPRCPFDCCCSRCHRRICFSFEEWGVAMRFGLWLTVL